MITMTEEKNESAPFIKNGVPATITKKVLIEKCKPGKEGRGKALKQVFASFLANLGTINTGMAFGFSAVALPQLQNENSTLFISEDQASWIASLSSAGTPIGCILSGYLMDLIGRRLTLILTEIPLILGWILISTSVNIPMMYIGRLLVGFGSGMVGAPARVYTCEVSQPHLRGMLGALASVGVSTGVLIVYVIGSITSWNILAGVCASVPMMSLLSMLFLPETPNFLLQQGRRERAESSLAKLRGSTCNLQEEIDKMIAFKEKNHVEPLKSAREVIKALCSPSALKPFTILAIYFFVYQWCGINSITSYSVHIFKATGNEAHKNALTIALGVVRVAFTIVGCIMCRRYGRRPLTFVSAAGCGITMLILGVYLYFLEGWKQNNVTPSYTWIPVGCIYLFMVFCTVGYLIIPWVMIGEVYPTQVRGIIGGMTTCVAHMSVFSVVKTYPLLAKLIGQYGIFSLYGAMSLFGILYFYFFLPETKGKNLQDIEDYFSGRTKTLNKKNSIQTAA